MRAFNSSSILSLSTILFILFAQLAHAKPLSPELARREAEANELFERAPCGGTPCGWAGQLCCTGGSTCYTDAQDRAQCGGAATGGSWSYGTKTYAVTRTSVYSSYIGQPTASCDTSADEISCGTICCRSDQYCKLGNRCAPLAGGVTTRKGGATASPSITATLPFETPVATGANVTLTSAQADSSGLSGGAIAGIVIGVLFGLLLLLLLLLFCCFKAAFDALLALIGLGGRRHRRTETEYIEEHHHHHGSSAAAGGVVAGSGRRWYGDRPARPARPPPKKSGGLGGLGAVAAGLGGLAVVLGMKRKHDKHEEKTEYTGSSYYSGYYSDYTSSSSESSSDRHTRHTRRSSRSRH